MIHPHHISTANSTVGMENWTKPTRKNLRFPVIIVAAAAMASVLIKPLPVLSLQFFTGEFIPRLGDSISGWMTGPYLFFLVNIIIMAILAMSKFQHNLDWTERGDPIQGRVKDNSLSKEKGDQFQGRVKEIGMPNERVDLFQGRAKEISLPNGTGDLFHGRMKDNSLPNEGGDQIQSRVKEISLPSEPEYQFHGRMNDNSRSNESEDQIPGKVKEINLPNETGDQFHGRMMKNNLPNGRGNQFQERVKKSSMPNGTGDQFHGIMMKNSLPNERVGQYQGRVKGSSLPNDIEDHLHGRVKEMGQANESGDEFHGRGREISLPNETEDEFHGRMKEIRVPNDHFEGKVRKLTLLSEAGEGDDEEDSEMCTKLEFLGGHGEERMLIGGRFASRKSKGKKMGQSLKVNHGEQEREETLESVWKKITEGRRPPLARHLRHGNGISNGSLHKAEKAEESALQMVLARDRSGGSTGQDELNKRVEAFIAKFNRDIKLQKQDSLLGYAESIHRGAI